MQRINDQATRTRDPWLLSHTMERIIRSDRLLTVRGVINGSISGIAGNSVQSVDFVTYHALTVR